MSWEFLLMGIIVCGTFVLCQVLEQRHEKELKGNESAIAALATRVAQLEAQKRKDFDPAAFEDLKAKVENMRFAQGFR